MAATSATSTSALLSKQFVKAPRSTDGGGSTTSLAFFKQSDLRRFSSSSGLQISARPRRSLGSFRLLFFNLFFG